MKFVFGMMLDQFATKKLIVRKRSEADGRLMHIRHKPQKKNKMTTPIDFPLSAIVIRTDLRPGDIGYIIYLHGRLYKEECDYGIV